MRLFIVHLFSYTFGYHHNQIRTYLGQLALRRQSWQGLLEVGDDLGDGDGDGDVGVHLVQLGVLGGHLPVLAPRHRVHNVLSERRDMFGRSCVKVGCTPG